MKTLREYKIHPNTIHDFKLKITKIKLGKYPGIEYKWIDIGGHPVAKFTTFEWWDGKNIEDLKIYDQYRGLRYSYQLLKFATKELGVKNLSVRKDNLIAKHIYDKYGFIKTEEDSNLYYMTLKS